MSETYPKNYTNGNFKEIISHLLGEHCCMECEEYNFTFNPFGEQIGVIKKPYTFKFKVMGFDENKKSIEVIWYRETLRKKTEWMQVHAHYIRNMGFNSPVRVPTTIYFEGDTLHKFYIEESLFRVNNIGILKDANRE